jgi:hypothetical protein
MSYKTKEEAKAASKARPNAATNAGLVELQIEYRAVGDLALDPRNPRQHSQRQINQIADSIREFGFVMPVVIDDTGQVVIGHGRVLAAKKLGMPRVPVIEIRHLSKAQLKALRIADNRLAQHAHWDERLLGESFLELTELDVEFDLSITGFSLPEIDLTLQKLDERVIGGTNDEFDAVTGVPVCQLGDGGSRMPELGPYGSVRGARGNSRPYRESRRPRVRMTRLTHVRHRAFPAKPTMEAKMSAFAKANSGRHFS